MTTKDKTLSNRGNDAEGKETFLEGCLHLDDTPPVGPVSVICERYGCVAFGRRHELEPCLPATYHHGLSMSGQGWRAWIDAMNGDSWEIQVDAEESLPSADAGALAANILVLVAQCEKLNASVTDGQVTA